jgi:hypothetical protein
MINQNTDSVSRDSAGRLYLTIHQLSRGICGLFLLIDGQLTVEMDIHGAHLASS